jgi:hypothetical protein
LLDPLQAPLQKINLQRLLPYLAFQLSHPPFLPPPLTHSWKRVPWPLSQLLPPAMQHIRIDLKCPRYLPYRRSSLQSLQRRQLELSAKLPPRQTHDAFLHSLNSASYPFVSFLGASPYTLYVTKASYT